MNKTAVIILNYNGAEMLRRFLPGVTAYSPDATVYVADNASTDSSCEVVRSEFPTVRLIQLEENYGFAEGYNRAIAKVEEEYVMLLNSDVQVSPNWLAPLEDMLDHHPDVAACPPRAGIWTAGATPSAAGASSRPWRRTGGSMTHRSPSSGPRAPHS